MRTACQIECWRSTFFGIDFMTSVGFQIIISHIGNRDQMDLWKLHTFMMRFGICSQMRRCMTSMSSLPEDMGKPQLS